LKTVNARFPGVPLSPAGALRRPADRRSDGYRSRPHVLQHLAITAHARSGSASGHQNVARGSPRVERVACSLDLGVAYRQGGLRRPDLSVVAQDPGYVAGRARATARLSSFTTTRSAPDRLRPANSSMVASGGLPAWPSRQADAGRTQSRNVRPRTEAAHARVDCGIVDKHLRPATSAHHTAWICHERVQTGRTRRDRRPPNSERHSATLR